MKEKIYDFIINSGIYLLQRLFPEYYAKDPLEPTDRYIEYPWAIKHIDRCPYLKVLDVGCSGTMFPLILQAMGVETYGIDIRRYSPKNKFFFYEGDISKYTVFENDYFDVVTAISTIEHIGLKGRYGVKTTYGNASNLDATGDRKALKEIYRILKPGGQLLMTVPFGDRFKIGKFHRTYNLAVLNFLLSDFIFSIETEQSPETNDKIALILAVK